jgi:hypothetical protein
MNQFNGRCEGTNHRFAPATEPSRLLDPYPLTEVSRISCKPPRDFIGQGLAPVLMAAKGERVTTRRGCHHEVMRSEGCCGDLAPYRGIVR